MAHLQLSHGTPLCHGTQFKKHWYIFTYAFLIGCLRHSVCSSVYSWERAQKLHGGFFFKVRWFIFFPPRGKIKTEVNNLSQRLLALEWHVAPETAYRLALVMLWRPVLGTLVSVRQWFYFCRIETNSGHGRVVGFAQTILREKNYSILQQPFPFDWKGWFVGALGKRLQLLRTGDEI